MFSHEPVLLQQVIEELKVENGKFYIDATLGGGGHTEEILKRGGRVLGIDQDKDARRHVQETLEEYVKSSGLVISDGNFRNIKSIAEENGFKRVSGILFDLGVSSYQLDQGERGFSIKKDEKLDMRMDALGNLSAETIVNTYSVDALADIFMRYGEEEHGHEVAEEIVRARKEAKIETTGQLVAVIEKVIHRNGKIHPATKVFQAIRIEVNQELDVLKEGLSGAVDLLDMNGRIVAISFHSLEDRIIKRTFDDWEERQLGKIITKKPITAAFDEVRSNPRARSAKLRVFEKNI